MASNACKSSCACAHEFRLSTCSVVAWPEFVFVYMCCIMIRVVGYCMHFLSECTWHLTILCFSNSNCLAPCLATMLQHQQLSYQHHTANALSLHSQFSHDSAAPLDQKNYCWKCRSGQNCLHCMHAHTIVTILWQAPYQSLLGGV